MELSKFLAKVLGLYLVIISIALLVNMHQFTIYVSKLINDGALMFVAGFFTLILGLLIVVGHNIWQWNWRVIVTIVGWLALLKGTSIILFPQLIDKVSILFIQNTTMAYTIAIIDLFIGILLCYFGFKHKVASES